MTHKSIHHALVHIMNEVGYVQKDGKVASKSVNYKYASEASLIRAIRPQLRENGVSFYCSNANIVNSEDFISKKVWDSVTTETVNHKVLGVFTFRFTHAESDTFIDAFSIGEGVDTGDKAGNKAATGALKYALRQTFIIETGDDPDTVSSEEQTVQTQPQAVAPCDWFAHKFTLPRTSAELVTWFAGENVSSYFADQSEADRLAIGVMYEKRKNELDKLVVGAKSGE